VSPRGGRLSSGAAGSSHSVARPSGGDSSSAIVGGTLQAGARTRVGPLAEHPPAGDGPVASESLSGLWSVSSIPSCPWSLAEDSHLIKPRRRPLAPSGAPHLWSPPVIRLAASPPAQHDAG